MLWKKVKNVIVAGMLVTMAASLVTPDLAAADNKSGNSEKQQNKKEVRVNLGDVSNHWAQKNISRLSTGGIITGYADGTFKPEKKVTTLEAVAMAVRLMGLTPAEDTKAITLPYTDAAAIPTWGKGYVDLALQKGIIDPGKVFQPNKPATRLEVTTLLVRTLGLKPGTQEGQAQIKFIDIGNLSPEQRQYIAVAVINGLLTGYEDGTFKPNKPVTRAELATLFARAQENDYIGQIGSYAKGVVLAINVTDSKIKVQTNVYDQVYGNTREFVISPNASIFRNNKVAVISDLKAQDKVELLLNANNEVVFIDAKENDSTELVKVIKGTVTSVDSSKSTIGVIVSKIVEVKYNVAADAVIERDGKSAVLSEIQIGDKVEMQRNAQGVITKITAESKEAPVDNNQKDKVDNTDKEDNKDKGGKNDKVGKDNK